MDRKMGPGDYNQSDDDSAPTDSYNSNLDDTVTAGKYGNTVPVTVPVFNPRWIELPGRLCGTSIKPMKFRVPDHGELEPFPTTKNIDGIAQ
jgi:hypothetical protein